MGKFGYINLVSAEEISYLHDCVVYWDEPQLALAGLPEYRKNEVMAKFCSLAGQRNILLIISSSDTRTFTSRMEAYVELWLIKDVDYAMTKQRSKIRQVIRNNCLFMPEAFRLENNEFVVESRLLREFNGKHTFELPIGWSESLSKPYAIELPETPEKLEELPETVKKNCEKKLIEIQEVKIHNVL